MLPAGADARRHVPPTGLPGVRFDAPPPDFSFDLGAGRTSLSDLAGRPVLINFWASYCGPCIDELPAFARVRALYGDRVRLITLSNEGEHAREYLSSHGLDLPLIDDRDSTVWKKYGVGAIPVTILLRANGTVRFVAVGETGYEELHGLLGAP